MEAAQGTSFYQMADYQRKVADIIRRDPNVETFMASVGGGFGGSAGNSSRMNVILKPRRQRPLTANQIIEKLRPQLINFPGFRVFMTMPPTIRIGGRPLKSAYELTLQGPGTEKLYIEAPKIEKGKPRGSQGSQVTRALYVQ